MPTYFTAFQQGQAFQYLGTIDAADGPDAATQAAHNHGVPGRYLAIDVANVEEFEVTFNAPQVKSIPPGVA